MKVDDIITIQYIDEYYVHFYLNDLILLDGIYKTGNMNKEIQDLITRSWLPGIILVFDQNGNCHDYTKRDCIFSLYNNTVKLMFENIGVDYDSYKKIFET